MALFQKKKLQNKLPVTIDLRDDYFFVNGKQLTIPSRISDLRDKVSYDIEKWKNLENKYSFLPSVDELGKYTDLNFKFFHKDMLMFESDAYVLKVTYGDEVFDRQKDYINNNYVMQEKVYENRTEREASFTLDGFYFRMLSQNEYKLYYPKTIAFIGVSEESNEIAYVFYGDVDLDYIGSSFPDFLIEDCGWE